jgi:hypothetical protein
MVSIYEWTWDGTDAILPPHANSMVAFSGWSNIGNAIYESSLVGNSFNGDIYMSFGGGNTNGRLTKDNLAALNTAITDGSLSRYAGICYDVEEGDTGLSADLEASFAVAKNAGKKVLVSVSHSAPSGMSDRVIVMDDLFKSSNIDFISPQLYTTGTESENDYTAWDVSWESWATSKAPVVVSIVNYNYYAHAQTFFAGKGITLHGYIQWGQNVQIDKSSPVAAPVPTPVAAPVPVPTSPSCEVCAGYSTGACNACPNCRWKDTCIDRRLRG